MSKANAGLKSPIISQCFTVFMYSQLCQLVAPCSVVERGDVDVLGEGAVGARQGGDDQRVLDVASIFKLFHTVGPVPVREHMALQALP